MRLSSPGGYGRRSRSSRTASMPRLLAASISTRSRVTPSRMATHEGQASQASPSRRSVQLTALARIRASDVLPVPRGPTKRIGVGDATGPDRVAERLDDRLLADDLAERLGAPAAVDGLMRNGRRHQVLGSKASGIEMPCTLRRADRPRAHHDGRLGPGRAAAPDDDRLVLLPSGPDTVRGSPMRGTRSSTSHRRAAFEDGDLGRGFSPAGADCRYRAPLVPRLARPGQFTRLPWRAGRSGRRSSSRRWSRPRRRRARSERTPRCVSEARGANAASAAARER